MIKYMTQYLTLPLVQIQYMISNDKFNDAVHDAVFGVVRGRVYYAPP
jgi:hypothetical protein